MTTAVFDAIRISVRGDAPLAILQFYQAIPSTASTQRIEIFRGLTTIAHAKQLVDLMCKSLGYYPTKSAESVP